MVQSWILIASPLRHIRRLKIYRYLCYNNGKDFHYQPTLIWLSVWRSSGFPLDLFLLLFFFLLARFLSCKCFLFQLTPVFAILPCRRTGPIAAWLPFSIVKTMVMANSRLFLRAPGDTMHLLMHVCPADRTVLIIEIYNLPTAYQYGFYFCHDVPFLTVDRYRPI